MAYDSVNRKVLLFGGQSPAGALFNDVWEFDTLSETWTDVTPVGTPMPSPRSRFGMAFDTARNVVVIYGGHAGGSPGTNDETWEWNPVNRRWTFRGNAGVIDFAGRAGAELAFDPNLNRSHSVRRRSVLGLPKSDGHLRMERSRVVAGGRRSDTGARLPLACD